jgi:hypothetical protein
MCSVVAAEAGPAVDPGLAADAGLAMDKVAENGAARSTVAARSVRAGMNSLISGFLLMITLQASASRGNDPTATKREAKAFSCHHRTLMATVPALTTS